MQYQKESTGTMIAEGEEQKQEAVELEKVDERIDHKACKVIEHF